MKTNDAHGPLPRRPRSSPRYQPRRSTAAEQHQRIVADRQLLFIVEKEIGGYPTAVERGEGCEREEASAAKNSHTLRNSAPISSVASRPVGVTSGIITRGGRKLSAEINDDRQHTPLAETRSTLSASRAATTSAVKTAILQRKNETLHTSR